MRLAILRDGHTRAQKAAFWLMRRVVDPVPGPLLTMTYRPELFGRFYAACLEEGMRGATRWTNAEVELFAAFVSVHNRCHF